MSGTPRDADRAVQTVPFPAGELSEWETQQRQNRRLETVGRLAGGIAHDFNNLLTVILGYAELLLGKVAPADPLREGLVGIQQAAEHAAALTRQLLIFSRKQALAPQVLDLNLLVLNLDRMLRRLIGETIDLWTLLGADLGSVRADPGQIEQVIMNLALNARDAMPQGGRLTIETANAELDEASCPRHGVLPPGRYVMLAVSDTGCGMDAETRARAFEPFFTTKEMGRGTGLGLATVDAIVQACGGGIWLFSESGRGTTFKIFLPRLEERAGSSEHGLSLTEVPGGSETVLLVEDDELVRGVVSQILRQYGYQVLEAGRGDEAIAACGRHYGPIHLLMADLVLPEINGRDLAQRLTRLRREMKVLYTSGYTDEAVHHHGLLEGAFVHLPKPFSAESLARKVREVLENRSKEPRP
jgi:nitrogen-specific signal transduction histidine kinase/ActR/RegA family two-component response regulator